MRTSLQKAGEVRGARGRGRGVQVGWGLIPGFYLEVDRSPGSVPDSGREEEQQEDQVERIGGEPEAAAVEEQSRAEGGRQALAKLVDHRWIG